VTDINRLLTFGATLVIAMSQEAVAAAPSRPTGLTPLTAILESGNPERTLSQGYSTIETATVVCHYATCTLGLSIMSNVGQATCKNEWAIVGVVDGNSVDGGPLLESLPNAGETQTHVWQGVYSMTTGSHTIAFELYLPCAANANQWSVRDLIATP
jgi:hypothetical protein